MIQNGLRPTTTGTEHITERETSTSNDTLVVIQSIAAAEQVTHVHVDSREVSAHESRRHLVLTVYALLAKNCDTRLGVAAQGSYDIVGRIERQFDVQSWITIVKDAVEFFFRRRRIITQCLNAVAHFRPLTLHGRTIQLQHHLVIAAYGKPAILFNAADSRHHHAAAIQYHLYLRQFALCHLHNSAEFFAEQLPEQFLSGTTQC